MLLQIGTVMFQGNRGASFEGLGRKTEAALAEKGLLSGLPGHEWTGWSGEITLTGTVLPFHLGGLSDVESLHGWSADGTAVPLIRGDGTFLGWHGIRSVSESHKTMARNGIGYEVEWTVTLVRMPKPSTSAIQSMIGLVDTVAAQLASVASGAASSLTSLFG